MTCPGKTASARIPAAQHCRCRDELAGTNDRGSRRPPELAHRSCAELGARAEDAEPVARGQADGSRAPHPPHPPPPPRSRSRAMPPPLIGEGHTAWISRAENERLPQKARDLP